MLKLSSKWAPFFRSLPETGMGYWIVDVVLKDGRQFERVCVDSGVVVNIDGSQVIPFTESDIAEFKRGQS